ncbi:MAG: acyl carrier protein [Planctomycetes bacterium]|nr:acyl carrier protein [Planctomycetota bacterium]
MAIPLEDRVRELIVRQLRLGIDPGSIDPAAPLFGEKSLGLDSIDALELIVGIEKEFGVQIPDDASGRRALASVSALTAHLRERGGVE